MDRLTGRTPNEYGECSFDCEWKRPITRPPQSYFYVEEGAGG